MFVVLKFTKQFMYALSIFTTAFFHSQAQPDKLYIRGRLWQVGR